MLPRRALGRGLEEVLVDVLGDRRSVPVASIEANPRQPRLALEDSSIEGLVASVRRHGVLQPLLVTGKPEHPGSYILIAGERRWRAAQQAGLEEIPVTVIETSDRERLELALVENLQRSDLEPLDRARAYRALIDDFGLTQAEVAETLGLSRPTVANTMRLLDLEPASREALSGGSISEGHARALLAVEPGVRRDGMLQEIIKAGLSVRGAEQMVRQQSRPQGDRELPATDIELQHVERQLQRALGTRVRVRGTREKGRVVIEYYGSQELSSIVQRVLGD